MNTTPIEWTDKSLNPIRARRIDGKQRLPGHYCEKISPGCANCYASKWQPRYLMPSFGGKSKFKPLRISDDVVQVSEEVEVILDHAVLQSLLKLRKPSKIFWCDMTDLFGDWVPFEWIDQCVAVMALTPHLIHQVLTKRPKRMAEYLTTKDSPLDRDRWDIVSEWAVRIGKIVWDARGSDVQNYYSIAGGTRGRDLSNRRVPPGWPLPNVWLGTSCEDQKRADERILHLLKCPAAVRFLSVEPLLGPIDLTKLYGGCGYYCDESVGHVDHQREPADWVIVGGESGPRARPMHPAWVTSIRAQCIRAGVPFFFKQWGEYRTTTLEEAETDHSRITTIKERAEDDDSDKWPMTRVGKKAAGRMLDGREWNEMPQIPEPVPAAVNA